MQSSPNAAALRSTLLGRAARALGAPVDWQAVHATETDARPEPGAPSTAHGAD